MAGDTSFLDFLTGSSYRNRDVASSVENASGGGQGEPVPAQVGTPEVPTPPGATGQAQTLTWPAALEGMSKFLMASKKPARPNAPAFTGARGHGGPSTTVGQKGLSTPGGAQPVQSLAHFLRG